MGCGCGGGSRVTADGGPVGTKVDLTNAKEIDGAQVRFADGTLVKTYATTVEADAVRHQLAARGVTGISVTG